MRNPGCYIAYIMTLSKNKLNIFKSSHARHTGTDESMARRGSHLLTTENVYYKIHNMIIEGAPDIDPCDKNKS